MSVNDPSEDDEKKPWWENITRVTNTPDRDSEGYGGIGIVVGFFGGNVAVYVINATIPHPVTIAVVVIGLIVGVIVGYALGQIVSTFSGEVGH